MNSIPIFVFSLRPQHVDPLVYLEVDLCTCVPVGTSKGPVGDLWTCGGPVGDLLGPVDLWGTFWDLLRPVGDLLGPVGDLLGPVGELH